MSFDEKLLKGLRLVRYGRLLSRTYDAYTGVSDAIESAIDAKEAAKEAFQATKPHPYEEWLERLMKR